LDDKEFAVIDKKITEGIPDMTIDQLERVEIWGYKSRDEQDKRFPELWESGEFTRRLEEKERKLGGLFSGTAHMVSDEDDEK